MALGALGSVRYVGRNTPDLSVGPRLGRFRGTRVGTLAARKFLPGSATLAGAFDPTSVATLRRFGARGVHRGGLGQGSRRFPPSFGARRRFSGLETHAGAGWDPSAPEPTRAPRKRKGRSSKKAGRAVKCKMVCTKGGKKRRMCWDKNGMIAKVPKKKSRK